jgi:hypothetical protein
MAIKFACEDCGKTYEVPDNLAGKKGRCKACGHVFHIPVPGGPPTDVYGLEETEVIPPSELPAEEAASPMPSSRRRGSFGPMSSSAATVMSGRSTDHSELNEARGTAFGAMGLGTAIFLLPIIGLQIKGLHLLPPVFQAGIGATMFAWGLMLLSLAYMGASARTVKLLFYAYIAVSVIAGLIAMTNGQK